MSAATEKELKEKINKLERELDNANDLVSATKRKGLYPLRVDLRETWTIQN